MNTYTGNRPKKPNNTAKTPKPRDNVNKSLPHNAFTGGKKYRKAQAWLAVRVKDFEAIKVKTGFSKPGAL